LGFRVSVYSNRHGEPCSSASGLSIDSRSLASGGSAVTSANMQATQLDSIAIADLCALVSDSPLAA
jgi:hypothetical protein